MKNDELTVLMTVNDPAKAEVVKIALRDNDLFCAIEGEYQAGLTGVVPIRIMVRTGDVKRASEIVVQDRLDK